MTLIQRGKLLMYKVERVFLQASQAIIGSLPGYQENYVKLDSNITAIEAEIVEQERVNKGTSDLKNTLKMALAKIASEVSRKLVAYANNIKDILLMNEIDFTLSELQRSTDEDLVSKATCILGRSTSLVEELTEYEITATLNTTLLSAINGFKGVVPTPRSGSTSQSSSTARMLQLFKETDEVMDNIDKIVEIVHYTQPVFFQTYHEKRKLPPGDKTIVSMKGIVLDEATGIAIKGVNLAISMNGNVLYKRSADKGGFILKTLPPGMCLIKASKNGYASCEVTVAVNDGEMSKVEIKMRKL